MSKLYEYKMDEERKDLEEAEKEFLSKRNMQVEKNVTRLTIKMVEAEQKHNPIMARWYRKQIQNAIPNYDEYRKEAVLG